MAKNDSFNLKWPPFSIMFELNAKKIKYMSQPVIDR